MIKFILFLRKFKIMRECAPSLFEMSPEQIKGERNERKALAKLDIAMDEAEKSIHRAADIL